MFVTFAVMSMTRRLATLTTASLQEHHSTNYRKAGHAHFAASEKNIFR